MAYELSNPVRRVGPQNDNGPTLWTYADGDNLATIDASGYFNLDAAKLKVGDFLFTKAGNGYGISTVVSNTRDLTSDPIVEGVVDTSNHTAIGAIDSD